MTNDYDDDEPTCDYVIQLTNDQLVAYCDAIQLPGEDEDDLYDRVGLTNGRDWDTTYAESEGNLDGDAWYAFQDRAARDDFALDVRDKINEEPRTFTKSEI